MSLPKCVRSTSLEESPEVEQPIQSAQFVRLQVSYAVGAKVTLYYPGGFLLETTRNAIQVTIMDSPEWHGYVTPGGGWSLIYYKDDAELSYRVKVRKRNRRKLSYLRLDDVNGFKLGW